MRKVRRPGLELTPAGTDLDILAFVRAGGIKRLGPACRRAPWGRAAIVCTRGPAVLEEGVSAMEISRRDILRFSVAGSSATALGGLVGSGVDRQPVRTQAEALRIANAKVTPSVCPFCSVGCATLVHTVDGQIVNIEGDSRSPHNEGTLCPKGAATFQLHINPNRPTQVLHRAPGATGWEVWDLNRAMDRVAELVKQTPDQPFIEPLPTGKVVNTTPGRGAPALSRTFTRPSARARTSRFWAASFVTSSRANAGTAIGSFGRGSGPIATPPRSSTRTTRMPRTTTACFRDSWSTRAEYRSGPTTGPSANTTTRAGTTTPRSSAIRARARQPRSPLR